MFVILLLGLIAAGIFTHSPIWYILAGVLGGLWLLVTMVALIGAGVAIKRVNRKMGDMDSKFDSGDFFRSRGL